MASNGWVLSELFVVFIIMWYLCDSLGTMKYTFYKPMGYDIDHVYELSPILGGVSNDTTMKSADKYLEMLRRLRREPGIESATLAYWSSLMGTSNRYNQVGVNDSTGAAVRILNATDGYTQVFGIKESNGHEFDRMPTRNNCVIISSAVLDKLYKRAPDFNISKPLYWYGDSTNNITIYGVIEGIRTYRYGGDLQLMLSRLDEKEIVEKYADYPAKIIFRVKPDVDGADYRQKFLEQVAPRMDVDNMFVPDVVPYYSLQTKKEMLYGDVDRVNTNLIVGSFLLMNVFLGLIGTFWFRTRRRRSEIALRMSLGSSRKQIFMMLLTEGLLLLSIAAIPAILICFNVGIAEMKIGDEDLISTFPIEWSAIRFILSTIAAWIMMALMIVIGIWFPAKQAMKLQVAEALHDQ